MYRRRHSSRNFPTRTESATIVVCISIGKKQTEGFIPENGLYPEGHKHFIEFQWWGNAKYALVAAETAVRDEDVAMWIEDETLPRSGWFVNATALREQILTH